MNKNTNQHPQIPPQNNKSSTIVGAIIIIFGVFLLLNNLNLGDFFPSWILSFPMILIIIGLIIGVNSKFTRKSSLILITIGAIFLIRKIFGNFNPGQIIFPAMAIIAGIYIINRNRKAPQIPISPDNTPPTHPSDEFDWDRRVSDFDDIDDKNSKQEFNSNSARKNHAFEFSENYIKVDSMFGNDKKKVISKNLLGGTITNIFGGSVINLLQADINQPIVIDTFQLFGSTKIIVPPHWVISSTISSVFGDIDDRRIVLSSPYDESKKIYLTGTSIFSTVTIKNS